MNSRRVSGIFAELPLRSEWLKRAIVASVAVSFLIVIVIWVGELVEGTDPIDTGVSGVLLFTPYGFNIGNYLGLGLICVAFVWFIRRLIVKDWGRAILLSLPVIAIILFLYFQETEAGLWPTPGYTDKFSTTVSYGWIFVIMLLFIYATLLLQINIWRFTSKISWKLSLAALLIITVAYCGLGYYSKTLSSDKVRAYSISHGYYNY